MSQVVNSSLKTATRGTILVFFGMVASILLWFAAKILIVRNTTKEEFGIYSLVLAVGGILSLVATLGLQEGVTRYISLLAGAEKDADAKTVSQDSLTIGIVSSCSVCALLFLFSGLIARYVFYKPEIEMPLRIISFFIPFSAITSIVVAVSRGFNIMKIKVFADVGQPLFFLLMVGVTLMLHLPFISILYSYVLCVVILLALILFPVFRKIRLNSFALRGAGRGIELLRFSFPLLASAVLVIVLTWADTLMLGRYTGADQVGIYNVSSSLARLLTFPLFSLGFVFMPLAGEMYARGQMEDLKRTYQVLTKWIFSVTLPIFFILFFFPEMTIIFLFGDRFVDSSTALRILSLGFLFNSFLGVNGMLLTVMGRTRELMSVSALGTVLNVILNYVLIKRLGMGIIGASVATLASYVLLNVLLSVLLYRLSSIHPVTKEYIYPVIGSVFIGLIIYGIAKSLPLYFWMLPLYLLAFVCGYCAVLLLTKSVEREDLYIFEQVLKKVGVQSQNAKRIIGKFSRSVLP
jgi:O-antigen/teichoic acid export membrane protein